MRDGSPANSRCRCGRVACTASQQSADAGANGEGGSNEARQLQELPPADLPVGRQVLGFLIVPRLSVLVHGSLFQSDAWEWLGPSSSVFISRRPRAPDLCTRHHQAPTVALITYVSKEGRWRPPADSHEYFSPEATNQARSTFLGEAAGEAHCLTRNVRLARP